MIENVKWDSAFFNLKIGKVYIENCDNFTLEEIENFDLIYVFSSKPNLGFKLVDKKIVYVLEDLSNIAEHNFSDIQFYNSKHDNYNDILNLTLQSGEYSRFKLDTNFVNNEFEKLYKTWIDKSISGDLATDIIIKKNKNKIVGFTTLTKKSDELADIGLVAVDINFRGQGIAQELILKTIITAKNQGYKKMQVITQLDNIPANKLYVKTGFIQDSITYIYHIWKHDTI